MANNNINLKVGVDYTELTGLIKTTDQTKRALSLVSKEFSNTKDQGAWMRGVNQIIQAQKKLDVSARMSRSEIMKMAHEMNQAAQFSNALSVAAGKTSVSVGQMGRRMSRTGVMFQQSGYQIGDFIVQVQSGQNAMVAFGQQATQMAGTLTMMGGKMLAIGTGLGIAIPLITAFGAAWMRTRKGIDESAEALKTLEQNLDSLDNKLEQWLRTKKAASLGVTVDELLGYEGLDKAKSDLKEAQDALADLVKQAEAASLVGGSGAAYLFGATLFGDGIEAAEEAVIKAQKRLSDLRSKEAEELAAERARLDRETLAGSIRAAEEARVKITQAEIEAENEKVRREQAIIDERARQAQSNEIVVMTANINSYMDAWESGQKFVIENQEELNDLASVLGDRLGTSFATALQIIRAAKAEASVGLDAFGGGGDFKYDLPQTIKAPKTNKGGGASQQDVLAKLRERIKLDTELLGKTKERQEVERAIANSSVGYSQAAIDQAVAELEAYNQMVEKRQELQGIYDTAQSSMEEGFMAMVEGTKSVEDAFKDMARSVIKELYDVLVVQRLVGSFDSSAGTGSGIMGFIGKAISSFDGGGYTGSGPRSGGMDGRGGYLAMLHPRETVVDHTKAGSAGGEGVTVVQNFNFQANGDDSVKKIIAQAAPSIANMAKQSVMDARRRGGAMKNTFG